MISQSTRCTVLTALLMISCSPGSGYAPEAGDILFQDLNSSQGQAVKLATGSEYTHCGIVLEKSGRYVVYEAVGPVRITPLQEWIEQGVNGHIVVKRLDTLQGRLSSEALDRMRAVGERHLGKPYDIVFSWTDDKLYCSELVWKMYYEGFDLALAPPRQLGDYDLSHPAVKEKLVERYGDSIPLDEPVVAPSDLFDSRLLRTVYQNRRGD